MNEQENINSKADAQIRYCNAKGIPLFAPNDGICFSCHRQIYENISMVVAGGEHITGCPRCHRSYCD